MQTLEARSQYRNALHCAFRIYTEEGISRFWTGTTPRLTRLVVRAAEYLDCLVVTARFNCSCLVGLCFRVTRRL